MKPLAIFLVILVIAALAGVGYLYFTSNITVSFVSVTATDPASQLDTFDQVKAAVENDTFVGTRYSSAPLQERRTISSTPGPCIWRTNPFSLPTPLRSR